MAERDAEESVLVEVLMADAGSDDEETRQIARRIAVAAMKPGHLWHAMELSNREELSAILKQYFRTLFEANTKDMRWKKFLYKRMCGWPGFEA